MVPRRHSVRLASNGALFVVVLALLFLGACLLPLLTDSREAVRLRNALLFDEAASADFDWTPEQSPVSFARDRTIPHSVLSRATTALLGPAGESDWQRSLRIANHLLAHAGRGGAAQSDLEGTYRIILAGSGYCADYTSTFIAMASAAGIFAREWGFSFNGYGGGGHVLVEIWDRDTRRWQMLDVFNNFYAAETGSGQPLSAMAFRERLASGRDNFALRRLGPGRDGFRDQQALLDYYRRGVDEWYLWWGNAVYRYDASWAVRTLGPLSRSAEQLVAIATGVHPRMRALPTPGNGEARHRIQHLRKQLLAGAVIALALMALLATQLWLRWRKPAVDKRTQP